MLQLAFAIAFSAVPLTLYIPPIRSFNHLVHTIQQFLRGSNLFSLHPYSRITPILSRIFNSIVPVTW
ncbi:hypothetical protein RIF29_39458 [Crotalaria pallida]|uniref:Uncharacterized protein n=1 Tax=Crotalaria pallida TaxID=3830 RepID=A0AAN9E1A4_CROPI